MTKRKPGRPRKVEPVKTVEPEVTADMPLEQQERLQQKASPVAEARIARRPVKVNYDLTPEGQIVYRSRYEFTAGIAVGGYLIENGVKKPYKFKCAFDRHEFVVTQSLADSWSESTPDPITVEDICVALHKQPSYGREFMLVRAPGYKPSDKVEKFNQKCLKKANEKKTKILSGVRTTGAR